MLTLVPVTKDNLDDAVFLQHVIFPSYSAEENYRDAVTGKTKNRYYLVYDGDACIGITGLYSDPDDPDNAWLGWFGVRGEFRRRHYGSAIIALFEEQARSAGFRYARIYTDRYDNDTAIAFYTSCGYTSETYDNPDDPACYTYPILIFSKALYDDPVPLWNNRSIHLTEQMRKELKEEH
ncbi:MAG: GNAT family N-acetyltransferase [Solobacterium sp.]|nr:GNAT family N-acetyltransferase [Solobacterium sp.]